MNAEYLSDSLRYYLYIACGTNWWTLDNKKHCKQKSLPNALLYAS